MPRSVASFWRKTKDKQNKKQEKSEKIQLV